MIGVASIGVRMLTGRTNVRLGATIICGCFILLAAASVAAGLQSVADGLGGPAISAAAPADPPPAIPVKVPVQNDPYADIAVFR